MSTLRSGYGVGAVLLTLLLAAGCGSRPDRAQPEATVFIDAGMVIGRMTAIDADAAVASATAEERLRKEIAAFRSAAISDHPFSEVSADRLGDTPTLKETYRTINRQHARQRLRKLPISLSVSTLEDGKTVALATCRVPETQILPEVLLVQTLTLPPERRLQELPDLAARYQAEGEAVLAEVTWRHAIATPEADADLWLKGALFFSTYGNVALAEHWAENALILPGSLRAHTEAQALIEHLQTSTPEAGALMADLRSQMSQYEDASVLTAGPAAVDSDRVLIPRRVAGAARRLYALWWGGGDLSRIPLPDQLADGDGEISLTLHRDSSGGELLLWALPESGDGWAVLERSTCSSWPIGPATDLRARLELRNLLAALRSFGSEGATCAVTVQR